MNQAQTNRRPFAVARRGVSFWRCWPGASSLRNHRTGAWEERLMATERQLRFGYGFDMRNPKAWFRPWPDFYAETIEFIEHIESLGFGNVWIAEHHGIDDGYMPSPV